MNKPPKMCCAYISLYAQCLYPRFHGIGSKICIKFRLIIRSKFVTNKVVTRGEGVKANGDKV